MILSDYTVKFQYMSSYNVDIRGLYHAQRQHFWQKTTADKKS